MSPKKNCLHRILIACFVLVFGSTSTAALAKPKSYIDVVDDKLELVVDGQIVKSDWLGRYDATEHFKSHPEAHRHMQDYERRSDRIWPIYWGSLAAFIGSAVMATNTASDQAAAHWVVGGQIALVGGLIWFLYEAQEAQFSFIRGVNAYNGVYDGIGQSSAAQRGFKLTPTSLSYNF